MVGEIGMKMWITRSSLGHLKMHFDKPYKVGYGGETIWASDHECSVRWINPFPEVTFENSPMEVELVLKK